MHCSIVGIIGMCVCTGALLMIWLLRDTVLFYCRNFHRKERATHCAVYEWVGKSYKKCETNFLRFMPEGTISSHIEHKILYIGAIGTLCTLILCWEIICMKKRKRFYLWEIPSTLAFPTEHHFPPFLNIPHVIGYPFMNNQVTAAL